MKPLDRVMLKQPQIQELQEEKESLQATLAPTNPFRNKISKPQLLHARIKNIEKTLEANAPEPLPGEEKDRLAKMELELREKITHGMPTEEEMRKNPAGMVDRHRRWEKQNKRDILTWKNIRRQLEPDSDDPDLANLERYRPAGVMDRLVANAQISGAMNYRDIPQAQWDQAFEGKRPQNTALEQAKKVKRELTEEQKQVLRDRLAKGRALRRKSLATVMAQNQEV